MIAMWYIFIELGMNPDWKTAQAEEDEAGGKQEDCHGDDDVLGGCGNPEGDCEILELLQVPEETEAQEPKEKAKEKKKEPVEVQDQGDVEMKEPQEVQRKARTLDIAEL